MQSCNLEATTTQNAQICALKCMESSVMARRCISRCLLAAMRSPMYLLYYIHAIYTPATSALARRCTGGIACSIVSTWWCPNLKVRCSKLGT